MPLILDGTKGETFPSWTTATRPATPNAGQTGYNTTLGGLETYNGSAWVTPDFGPAFGVYSSANQTGLSSGAVTKVSFNTKEFDTNNNFDSTTNYRFTPTIAGFYQINFCAYAGAGTGTNLIQLQPRIYRNGSNYKVGDYISLATGVAELVGEASAIIQMNGSTDYLEFWVYAATSSGTVTINASQPFTYANGALIRTA